MHEFRHRRRAAFALRGTSRLNFAIIERFPNMMTPEQAMERINLILAHAWMVRNFLKHADEVQDDEEMLEVHRMVYDYARAVEPSRLRGDAVEYVRRARGKLAKLRRVADYFAANYSRVSAHTNFEMAATSLKFVVQQIEEVLEQTPKGSAPELNVDEKDG